MKLTCIANHPGVDVPDNFNSDLTLNCGVCGLPMRDQQTLLPSMSTAEFDEKVAKYFKAATTRAHAKAKAMLEKSRSDNPRADGKKDDGMGDLMMTMAGIMFVGFFEAALRELVVGAPDESPVAIAAKPE